MKKRRSYQKRVTKNTKRLRRQHKGVGGDIIVCDKQYLYTLTRQFGVLSHPAVPYVLRARGALTVVHREWLRTGSAVGITGLSSG